MSQNKANLDAWHVLRTVIDAGGFAQAASQLQRSQSAISYSINKLEGQLGLELLTIEGRRAVLTGSGGLLLERGRALLAEYDDMLDMASELKKGNQPALTLWIDSLCPTPFLKKVLGEFQTHFPRTAISISQSSLLAEAEHADLAVTTTPVWETGLSNLGELSFVAVAHPNYPLLGCDPPLAYSNLENYRQVSVRQLEQDGNRSVWHVSGLQQAIDAVKMGQAFGWLPQQSIKQELLEGSLKRLDLEHGERYQQPVYLQYNEQRPSGKARQALGEILIRSFIQSQS